LFRPSKKKLILLVHQQGTYCPEDSTEDFSDEETAEASKPKGQTKTIPLDEDLLILRGSQLRNTDAVYGLVVYAGKGNND